MLAYKYNELTKEYLYSIPANTDPLESQLQKKDVYLLPANATFTQPLESKSGHAVIWNGEEWEYQPDHRQKRDEKGAFIENSGTPYWLPDDTWESPARYMIELGDLPEGALLEKPEKPFNVLQQEKLSELSSKFSQAELEAHLTSSLNIVINAGEKANRDIDGLVKLMEAMPELETVDFCCYDNTFRSVSLAELKTMQLEVIQSGNSLYAQKWTFRNDINAATTKEELDAINIEFTYSDFLAL